MIDKGKCSVMSHVVIRDPDTDETILRMREAIILPNATRDDQNSVEQKEIADDHDA